MVGAVLLLLALRGWWIEWTSPPPPAIDLAGTDPVVAQLVTEALKALESNPGESGAWGQLGMVLRAHEYVEESNVCFRQAEKLGPEDPRWPYLLARGVRASNPPEAIDCLRRAIPNSGKVQSPRLLLGELLLEQGLSSEAQSLFEEVLSVEPDNARAHLALGRIAFERNDLPLCLSHLERSARVEPKVRATHALLSQVHSRLGNVAAAEEERRLMAPLGEEWFWRDPYQEEVVSLWVGLKARLSLALDLWNNERKEESIAAYQALVRDYPESDKAQFLLGLRFNQTGRFEEAEEPLRQAVRLYPEYARAHFELGYGLHQRGQITEAEACYQKAIERQPDFAVAHYNLHFCFLANGERQKAIESLSTAVRYKPDVAKAHRALGMLYLETGKTSEARAALMRAIELDPADQEARDLLARLPESAPLRAP